MPKPSVAIPVLLVVADTCADADRKRGVVAFSSGNHAQGVAESAKLLTELNEFFDIVEQMNAVDTSGVEPLYTPLSTVQEVTLRLREDAVSEADQERDLDGDGDRDDDVLHVYDAAAHSLIDTGIDAPSRLFVENGAVAWFADERAGEAAAADAGFG